MATKTEVKYVKRNFQSLKEFRRLPDADRQSLFGLAASRLVEDVLADLDRLHIFVGPIWRYFPMVEIQSSIASVLELPVEGLAGDLLGVRVRLIFPCFVRAAIAPPRELAGALFVALLDHSTDGVWEALMAEPVHNDIGDGFHLGFILAIGLPVDGAGKTGDRIVQGLFAGRIDRLRLGLSDDLGRSGQRLTTRGRGLLLEYLRLALGGFLLLSLVSRVPQAHQKKCRKKVAAHIRRIVEPSVFMVFRQVRWRP